MRVSVVVPVCDPGPYLHGLLESLEAQTLDPAEFETVFVDDGSTDGTAELLDRVAAERPNTRVIHIPASGWPGRPRNVGIEAARGDYVFLSDHDDRLDPEALERLTGFAAEHGSDVVIGRVVGVGRNAPDRIFERTLVDAQRDPALIMTAMAPQKLYRRAFLDEHAIRFPEGRRRLGDHLFVTKAYLRAARVSVYADHPVYYLVLRDDGQHASRSSPDWAEYFADAAESIAVVDAEAPDEAARVAMRARWLRTEALGRLRGQRFLTLDDRGALLAAVRGLVERHYPVAEIDRLAPAERLIGRLLLDGREADVIAFAAWEASLQLKVEIEGARLAARRLEVRLRAEPVPAGPLPPRFRSLPDGFPTAEALEGVAQIPPTARIGVRIARGRTDLVELAAEQRLEDGRLLATASLDLAGPRPIAEGSWRLTAVVRGMGRPRSEVPRLPRGAAATRQPEAVRVGERRYTLTAGSQRRLVLVAERAGLAADALQVLRRAAGAARRLLA
jgi:poly(ribitol-phosphate) beta-N-acetylglucosaminyltransferase